MPGEICGDLHWPLAQRCRFWSHVSQAPTAELGMDSSVGARLAFCIDYMDGSQTLKLPPSHHHPLTLNLNCTFQMNKYLCISFHSDYINLIYILYLQIWVCTFMFWYQEWLAGKCKYRSFYFYKSSLCNIFSHSNNKISLLLLIEHKMFRSYALERIFLFVWKCIEWEIISDYALLFLVLQVLKNNYNINVCSCL